LLERDLQKFLARNLDLIESGLRPSADYQLEEFVTDVGRLDLFCLDGAGRYVVVELKAGLAGDDVVGQIMGYMAWARENIAGEQAVRGIIVCRDAGPRVKAACKMVPGLELKKFTMSFHLEVLV
jgi:RecB family endonuclease NucS